MSSNKKRFANVLRHVSKFLGDSEYQAISFRLQPDCNGGKTNIIGNFNFVSGWLDFIQMMPHAQVSVSKANPVTMCALFISVLGFFSSFGSVSLLIPFARYVRLVISATM